MTKRPAKKAGRFFVGDGNLIRPTGANLIPKGESVSPYELAVGVSGHRWAS